MMDVNLPNIGVDPDIPANLRTIIKCAKPDEYMANYIHKMPFFEKLPLEMLHTCIQKKQFDIIAYDRGSII